MSSATSQPETLESDHIKSWLIMAAYTGAAAVFSGVKSVNINGVNVPVNPDAGFTDPGVRALAVCIFEEAKIQYQPILAAYQDQTGIFPNPHVPLGTSPGGPAASAGGALSSAIAQLDPAKLAQAIIGAWNPAALQSLVTAIQAASAAAAPAVAAVPTLGH